MGNVALWAAPNPFPCTFYLDKNMFKPTACELIIHGQNRTTDADIMVGVGVSKRGQWAYW